MATCYRHPNRETGVSCSNCGRPICPDCMTPTPVGMRCPECAQAEDEGPHAATMTRRAARDVAIIVDLRHRVPRRAGRRPSCGERLALPATSRCSARSSTDGDYWRLVTGGFLHSGFLHIGFNMYLLWILGPACSSRRSGSLRFAALYFTALLCGLVRRAAADARRASTVGASGAVFGLMGARRSSMRARGYRPVQAAASAA